MTDTNTFVNTYIDVILGTTHTQINEIVQLKTQLRLAEMQTQQLIQQISQLNDENQKLVEGSIHSARSAASRDDEIKVLNERLIALNDEMNGYKTKASHIDTFAKNIASRDDEIKVLNERIIAISEEMNGYKTKASHVDTFAKQVTELKERLKKTEHVEQTDSLKVNTPKVLYNLPEPMPVAYPLTEVKKEIEDDF